MGSTRAHLFLWRRGRDYKIRPWHATLYFALRASLRLFRFAPGASVEPWGSNQILHIPDTSENPGWGFQKYMAVLAVQSQPGSVIISCYQGKIQGIFTFFHKCIIDNLPKMPAIRRFQGISQYYYVAMEKGITGNYQGILYR